MRWVKKLDFLYSGRHELAYYENILTSVAQTGSWRGEVWSRRKSGEIFPTQCSVTAVFDDDGQITHYVHSLTDITQRKATEEEINKLAFYDPLTGLPNRRLLIDRLRQAMALSSRNGQIGGPAVHGFGQLQNPQRHLGPRHGRPATAASGQTLGRVCARGRHRIAPGRR